MALRCRTVTGYGDFERQPDRDDGLGWRNVRGHRGLPQRHDAGPRGLRPGHGAGVGRNDRGHAGQNEDHAHAGPERSH